MNALCLLAQDNTAGQMIGGFFGVVIGVAEVSELVIGVAATVFWLWMLIDAVTNEPTTNDKVLWFFVIFFLPVIGALVYLFVRRAHRRTDLR